MRSSFFLVSAVIPTAAAFVPSSLPSTTSTGLGGQIGHQSTATTTTTTTTTALGYSNGPTSGWGSSTLPPTNDPFVLLGLATQEGSRRLSPTQPVDEKELKRAYRKMTRSYHPDAITNKDSTDEERKRANDDFARINAAYDAILNPKSETAAQNAPKSQWAKPWYEQVNDFQTSGGVSDIFERNAQKKKDLRKNGTYMYENTASTKPAGARGTSGSGTTTNGSARPVPSSPNSPPFPRPNAHHRNRNNNPATPSPSPPPPPRRTTNIGGFSSSDSTSDIFERNSQKRDRDRRNRTGAYDPNQSALEDKLASLMKNAAEAEERYARLQRNLSASKASLQQQNDALRRDAADARARCKSLEEELVKAASKSEATANTMSSEEKAMLGGKIASLRKEANDAKARCQSLEKEVEKSKSALRREKGAMEEKIALAKARCGSLEAALKKSKAEMTDMLSSHGKGADDEEKEALKAKIASLEKDLRSHVDVVQKYRKESQSLRREARAESFKKAGDAVADGAKAGLNAIVENMKRADKRAAKANKDEMERVMLSESVAKKQYESLKEERNTKETEVATLKEALASSRDECRRLKAKMPSKPSASRIPTASRANMMPTHHDALGRADDFASAVGMATEGSKRVTAVRNKRSRIPTGVNANMILDTPKSIKNNAFSSAVGIVTEESFEDMKGEISEKVSTRGSTSSKRGGGLFRRASNQMHEKKTLVVAGSVALLVARSLLKLWIRGGLL